MSIFEPDLFTYLNYRQYLKDWLEYRNGRPSGAQLAQRVGWSRSQFTNILNGRRKLTREKANRICDRLELDSDEREYFLLLTHLNNHILEEEQRLALLPRIQELRRAQMATNPTNRTLTTAVPSSVVPQIQYELTQFLSRIHEICGKTQASADLLVEVNVRFDPLTWEIKSSEAE